ncbi:hypothetical protein K438DRAFT_1784463 [Mycena galopus ATCC 62051]|nr:hypothetical protein K438DRAFT_1784463 [Mycena galopus ATCC 62051]
MNFGGPIGKREWTSADQCKSYADAGWHSADPVQTCVTGALATHVHNGSGDARLHRICIDRHLSTNAVDRAAERSVPRRRDSPPRIQGHAEPDLQASRGPYSTKILNSVTATALILLTTSRAGLGSSVIMSFHGTINLTLPIGGYEAQGQGSSKEQARCKMSGDDTGGKERCMQNVVTHHTKPASQLDNRSLLDKGQTKKRQRAGQDSLHLGKFSCPLSTLCPSSTRPNYHRSADDKCSSKESRHIGHDLRPLDENPVQEVGSGGHLEIAYSSRSGSISNCASIIPGVLAWLQVKRRKTE